jgi:hypothetical protein
LWQDAESQPRERIELPFLKSEGSYLKMMDQINAYWVIFIVFFFFPLHLNIEGFRVCLQLVQHSLFTTEKPRVSASDLLLLLRHILGRPKRQAGVSWSQKHMVSSANTQNLQAGSDISNDLSNTLHPGNSPVQCLTD